MSFGINGPDNLPSIQPSHQTNDGGAGNLGYFRRRNKKEDDDSDTDIFEASEENSDGDEILMEELDTIGTKIKNFWANMNIIKKLKEENPEDE